MDEHKSRVYVLCDEQGRVARLEGEYTLPEDLTGWTLIDEGYGDAFNLAQTHYLDKPLYTEDGVMRYKLADGKPVERTAEEIAAEVPEKAVSPADQLRADVDFLAAMTGVTL